MPEENAVPSWVPEVAPGVRADVYPVSPRPTHANPRPSAPAELRLDRHAVTHGYAERRLQFEFATRLLTSSSDRPLASSLADSTPMTSAHLLKLREGLTTLRRARPTKLQRHELHVFNPPPSDAAPEPPKKPFPLQKPSASSSLEDWFNKLSSGSPFPTATLSRSVPLGPAIVRAAAKVIEMMATRAVPAQRAAWYVRIAVLNECVKQMRPDRPPPSPRAFWTRQLATLLRAEIEAIRARKTAVLGVMDRVSFWRYLLDLVRWQADEGLLDLTPWLKAVADVLRNELINAQSMAAPGTSIAVMAARRFLPEFVADPDNARLLCEVLIPSASIVIRAWKIGTSSRDAKTGKLIPRKTGKRTFYPNACHAEITVLLGSALRALDASIIAPGPELKISDLERFVKKGSEILQSAKEAKKTVKEPSKFVDLNTTKDRPHPAPVHAAFRECEMLPSHGDVARVAAAVQAASKEGAGACQNAVKTMCQWVVDGPVSDRAEAISIGTAVLTHIAERTQALLLSAVLVKPGRTPIASKRVKKSLHQPRPEPPFRPSASASASGSSNVDQDPPLQRDLWVFFKEFSDGRDLESLDKDNFIVRFLAQLCRFELLSLPAFVRDVSRLSSCSHPGSSFLVKCLSMLPDPMDKSIADCRRSLLRKFGYLSNAKSNYIHGSEDKVVQAAISGSLETMETEAEKLVNNGNTNVILSTSEAVRLVDISQLSGDMETVANKLYSITSFLLFVDEPGMVVEWLLDNLGDVVDGNNEWKTEARLSKRKQMTNTLTRLTLDLSRYIAACGQLETVYLILKKGYQSTWVSPAVREQILHSLAAMACTFGKASENGSMYWTKLCAKILKPLVDSPKSTSMIQFAVASLRGRVEVHSDEMSLSEILDLSNRENWGLTPDEDLQAMTQKETCRGVVLGEVQESLNNVEYEFPLESLFAKGLSANDIFGGIFIPVLSESLSEGRAGTTSSTPFSTIAPKILHLIESRQNDVRLQGLSCTIIIEFVAIIIAGCFCLQSDPQPPPALEILVRLGWLWRMLASRAGIKLSRRLRNQVDQHCEGTTTTEKSELSATLFNLVMPAWGDPGRDEMFVSSAIGSKPFGMVEMQLSLLAVHRRDCGEDELFGRNIAEAVANSVLREASYSLTTMTLACCAFEEDYRAYVSGIIAYEAVQKMKESLHYVVTGLTVDSTKNTRMHQERANQWYDADAARRVVLEHSVDFLSDEEGAQVESMLYDQVASVTTQLTTAWGKGCLPSSVLTSGEQIANAIESRLWCIARSKRTAQGDDVWRRRTLQIGKLLKSAAPLMKRSTVQMSMKVLNNCVRHIGECGRASSSSSLSLSTSDEKGMSTVTVSQILERHNNRDLKKQLQSCLSPTLYWTESPEREMILSLVGKGGRGANENQSNAIRAYKDEGTDIDNWELLEGYGRGADEDCSVSPTALWRQGDGGKHERASASVQLKRTYSTFASLVA